MIEPIEMENQMNFDKLKKELEDSRNKRKLKFKEEVTKRMMGVNGYKIKKKK